MYRTHWMRRQAAIVLTAALLVSAPALARAASAAMQADAAAITADVQKKLDKKQYKNVTATVDNGILTLNGTVELYFFKAEAAHRVQKIKGISAIRNLIAVDGPTVPDDLLQQKLISKLAYDRVGYGTTMFNAISVGVQGGVVTLGGHAYNYVDRDSALALVSTYPGVKDMIDDIEVDPTSIMDDQIRFAVAQAVYGYPSLNRYAVDPAKPIRISVQNGNVSLYGVVDSLSDKETAYIRANGVANVFSVKNYLVVANQSNEK